MEDVMKRSMCVSLLVLLAIFVGGCAIGMRYKHQDAKGKLCLSHKSTGDYVPGPVYVVKSNMEIPAETIDSDIGPLQFYSENCKKMIIGLKPGETLWVGNTVVQWISATASGMGSQQIYAWYMMSTGYMWATVSTPNMVLGNYIGLSGAFTINDYHFINFQNQGQRYQAALSAYKEKLKEAEKNPSGVMEKRFQVPGNLNVGDEVLKKLDDISKRLEKLEQHGEKKEVL